MKGKIILTVAFVLALSLAFADGIVVGLRPDGTGEFPWPRIVEESRQTAFISWENGMEQMIIETEVEAAAREGETYVWIFPVPADPQDVVVHHIRKIYHGWRGKDLYEETKRVLRRDTWQLFALSQVWPIVPAVLLGFDPTKERVRGYGLGTETLGRTGWYEKNYSITVHERIEEHGLTSEIITAREAEGLRRYIRDRYGVELPEEIEGVLSDYIGREFTFVVSESKGEPRAMAVMVEFPAEAPYFPLKPTSVYGSRTIPVTVYLDGFWEPNTWREIERRVEVEHRVGGTPPKVFGDEEVWGEFEELTVVSLEAPSKYLREDFHFRRAGVAEAVNALRKHSGAFSVVFLLILFSLSGALAWVVLGRKRGELVKYVVAGAASLLTPLATVLALKKAGVSGRGTVGVPVFERWWQNVAYYAVVTYTAAVLLTVLALTAWTTTVIMRGADAALGAAALLVVTGGGLSWVMLGALLIYFMNKKWRRSTVPVPILQPLTVILLNAVLYFVFGLSLLA